MNRDERPKPGLKAIYAGREGRQRGRFSRLTPRIMLSIVTAFLLIVLGYGFVAKRTLDNAKGELLAKRRAVETTLGPEWFPLRDKLEKLTLETAANWPGDWVDVEGARSFDFRNVPGIYLRLRVNEARDAGGLRTNARQSVKDGFTSCLLKGTTAAATRGDADAGLANEQPWNLRQAYASTRVLNQEWGDEVKASADDLRLRVFQQQFEKATREEIPLAIDIVKRAQFFLLVLDEDAPAALEKTDAGVITMEALQLVPHDARIRLWNLKTGAEVARVKRRGEASFFFGGEQAVRDPEALEAMQRQVNNCALANRFKEALSVK